MKLKLVSAALITLAMTGVSSVAFAEPAELKSCKMCHTGMVGPKFEDIAAKYTAADKEQMVDSITNGSSGKWGKGPMPPQKKITAETAGELADYILSLK